MIVRRALYATLGSLCLILALVGFVIPVLPGFLFLILAVVCFSAVSSRFARAVDSHPAASRLRRRWNRGANLPLFERIKLMFWLSADSVMGSRKR